VVHSVIIQLLLCRLSRVWENTWHDALLALKVLSSLYVGLVDEIWWLDRSLLTLILPLFNSLVLNGHGGYTPEDHLNFV
jgi:hypothetical protein